MNMVGKGIGISNLISLLCPVERSRIKTRTQKPLAPFQRSRASRTVPQCHLDARKMPPKMLVVAAAISRDVKSLHKHH
jgi:hypothetical protein